MKRVGIGLIGSGFMGRCHALAFRMAPGVFELPAEPFPEMLADADATVADRAARRLGFARATGDWRELIADPLVDLVDITAPNILHEPMALAALEAGKSVYCEKPLAPDAAAAKRLRDAAARVGALTLVGFNYLHNPMIRLARDMIVAGELGEIVGFRGIHAEDYMSDPATPWTWRLDPANGAGVIADLGSHIIALARFLVGPVSSVSGDLHTVHADRPVRRGGAERRAVRVDDQAQALIRFANGATGTIRASWIAAGRKMHLAFEITGTLGSLLFDQERLNELRHYRVGQAPGREGFTTILAGPSHPPYAAFCPAPGHQLGFNELKTIEVGVLLDALGGRRPAGASIGRGPAWPDFAEAWEVQRIVDAIVLSAHERRWVSIAEI